MPKANVFPEPVEALPMTSFPLSISGIVALWIGVGSANPSRARDDIVCEDRFKRFQAETIQRSVRALHVASSVQIGLPSASAATSSFKALKLLSLKIRFSSAQPLIV